MFDSDNKSQNVTVNAILKTRRSWLHIAVFSAVVNILMLTGSIYMMQVYDRVLASRSTSTLLGLSFIALAAYVLQGGLDHIRVKMLTCIGCVVDAALSPLTVRAALAGPLHRSSHKDPLAPFRDLAALRSFLGSLGPTAFLDLPFAPLFLFVCFMLHPWLGWLAVGGIVTILVLTVLAERLSVGPSLASTQTAAEQSALLETGRRNAEVVSALGMRAAFVQQFDSVHQRHIEQSLRITERSGGLSSFAKAFRFVLQSVVLGLGGYLVIRGEMSGGSMIAASIVTARALAPIELGIAHLKSFLSARQAYARLKESLPHFETRPNSVALLPPSVSLTLDDVALAPPTGQKLVITRATFSVKAGEAVGLIGPSGSGKSSLARAIVGAWKPVRGLVCLDGAALSQWDMDLLGKSIGYLPQDVELFPGTVAQNIARFDPEASSEAILQAAQDARAHDMIVALPDGYATRVGDGGVALSGGQRQRVALARALYGRPFLVVLDEPNSSLDADGDDALTDAIRSIKARGGIVIVITHRPSGLSCVDKVGLVFEGHLTSFGPRDDVLASTGAVKPPSVHAATPATRSSHGQYVSDPLADVARPAMQSHAPASAASPTIGPQVTDSQVSSHISGAQLTGSGDTTSPPQPGHAGPAPAGPSSAPLSVAALRNLAQTMRTVDANATPQVPLKSRS